MRDFFFSTSRKESWGEEDFWFPSFSHPAEVELTVSGYGESRVLNGCDFHRIGQGRIFSACALELVIDGSGWVTYSDGSRYHLTPGTLYMLPGSVDSRIVVPRGKKLIKTVILLRHSILLQLMLENSIFGAEYSVNLPADSRFPEHLKTIGQMVKNNPDAEELSTACYRLLLSLTLHYREERSHQPLQEVCDYMKSQINTTITLEKLASVANCSPVTLIRNFKNHFDCTPMQYLIDLRLNYAKTLLMQQLPVRDVATLCGYHSPKFFSREYRKKFGRSPSEEKVPIDKKF